MNIDELQVENISEANVDRQLKKHAQVRVKDQDVNPLLANKHDESTFTVGLNNEPNKIEVKVVQGGPVTPLF